jgi:hypothetical protein
VILVVDTDAAQTITALAADRDLLADLLNDMRLLADDTGVAARRLMGGPDGRDVDDAGDVTGGEWGELVLARAGDGQVLSIDPERYWDGIATQFRAHGDDPHRWRDRPSAAEPG